MHGRPRHRAGQAPSPMDKQEQAHAAELCKLMPLFMESNRTCCYSTESMNQNVRLLELNPDFLTAWNYRKRAVQHLWELESDRKRIAQTELDVVVRALRANPKCYGAWYHRKWIIRFGLSSLDAEFLLLKKLLKLDARNFHGWNYRRFVAKTKGVAPEEELRFTTDKINENFSNYSAWHNRSALLSEISKRTDTKNSRVQESLEEEYELVKTAFFTDPDDQSGWFYYSWLLGQTIDPVGTHVNGCWPPAESQVAFDLETNYYKLPFNEPKRGKLGALQQLPLVLSFSNAVTGVNNRTVSVNVDGNDPLELDWRPVEPMRKYGRKWTTDIMQHFQKEYRGQYAVNVLVGGNPGIVSVDGQECASLWQSRFHVLLGEITPLEDVGSVGEPVTGTSEVAGGSEIWQLNVLDGEIQSCRELLELESNSKWTMLTLARLLLTHASYNSSSRKSHIDEARTHFKVLGSLDPTHREYYQHQSSLLSLKELTEDSRSLRRQYEERGLLQLNQLSLCSVEFTERFLWIQSLDLSHNQLRSTHGLEALQVLVNLDLSHNRIGSVTALAPLRELRLLEDVDVSFNEIGDHTVDTCRLLCFSKLTNTAAPTPDFLKVGERWETKTVFGGLRWLTLNIAGNAAAEDVQFVDSLTRALKGTFIITDADYK